MVLEARDCWEVYEMTERTVGTLGIVAEDAGVTEKTDLHSKDAGA